MKKKKKNKKKKVYSDLDNRCDYLVAQLGEGLTLQQVADLRNVLYSDLISEINEHPRLIQAMHDGKQKGIAHWQNKLAKWMVDKDVNQQLIKLWLGNYMAWWDRPISEDFDENTTVIINVTVREPTKKERKGMEDAERAAA